MCVKLPLRDLNPETYPHTSQTLILKTKTYLIIKKKKKKLLR